MDEEHSAIYLLSTVQLVQECDTTDDAMKSFSWLSNLLSALAAELIFAPLKRLL